MTSTVKRKLKKTDKSSNKPLFIGFFAMTSILALLFGGGEENRTPVQKQFHIWIFTVYPMSS